MKADKLIFGLFFFTLIICQAVLVNGDDDIDDDDVVMEDDPVLEEPPEEPVKPEKREKLVYRPPTPKGSHFFAESFESTESFSKRWVKSQAKKDNTDEAIAKYDGVWQVEEPQDSAMAGDLALILMSKAKHHAIAAKLDKPFEFSSKPFIVQYEVKFQNGMDCGGAYVKLLTQQPGLSLTSFGDKTSYTIMFGPDKCGLDSKLHFIFRHKNPRNGSFEEKHAKKPTASVESFFTDKKTHLFTLVVHPDNLFEIFVDQKIVNSGSLLEDMSPPVNPPREIVDPEDKKPDDWDDRERIVDPDATKPDDWDETAPAEIPDETAEKPAGWLDDEPELIPDPEAEKPSDWDDDMDGEWEPPMISNPACSSAPGCGEWKRPMIKNPEFKGKWKAPMIENPNYKGKWKPKMIENPDYFEDNTPFKMTTIGAVGLELWSMSDGIVFDNFIVTDDKNVADEYAVDSWVLKHREEEAASSSKSVVQAIVDVTNERPWLWAVFIIVVALPIVLVIAYCCMSGSKSDEDDDAAARKKTDAVSPDDAEQEDVGAADGEDEKDEGAGGDAADAASGEGTKRRTKKADLEAENKEKESTEEEDTSESNSKGRKRKPRKD